MNVIKIWIKIWMGGVGQWLACLTRNRWTWGVGSNLIKGSPPVVTLHGYQLLSDCWLKERIGTRFVKAEILVSQYNYTKWVKIKPS